MGADRSLNDAMSDPANAKVVVAILTWRGEPTTRACLRSLLGSRDWTGATLIVDNGSGTGEGERLAKEFGVDSVTLATNDGVPAGYNAALRWARANGMSHALLANNDLEFTDPRLVSRLMAYAEMDVAGVGPIVRRTDGSISSAGGRLRGLVGHVQRTSAPWATVPYEVDALDGSCMLVSIDAVCRVGGLEAEFFLYWEETDWCARARRAGLRLVVDPHATVTHFGAGSGNLRQTRRYALRNSLLYIRRNVRGFAGLTASLLWLFGRVPFFVVRRLFERAGPRGILGDARWAIYWHVRDASRHGWRRSADGPDLCA